MATSGPVLADPWAWVALAAVVLVLVRSLGGPVGEPVADDFDHLHHALFSHRFSWFDGGGSASFWRPLPNQLYYALLHGVILSHPAWIFALHLACFAAVVLLTFDIARRRLPAPVAATVASFPLLLESARALVVVPVHFVDLGLILFSVVAWWFAERGWLGPALAALLAALLCKETAVATALVLPWLARVPTGGSRRPWLAGSLLVAVGWAACYLMVRRHLALTLPHGLEAHLTPALLFEPERYGWALAGSLRALASLPMRAAATEPAVAVVAVAVLATAAAVLASSPAARTRFTEQRGFALAGLAWFVLATGTLLPVHPVWSPERIVYSSLGLGAALGVTLAAAHPLLPWALVALRLVTFALAPGASGIVGGEPPDRGAFVDFERLTRLQRFMHATRETLRARWPELPPGAVIVQENLPHQMEYAFGGDRALQVWYREPTLRWMRFETFRAHPDTAVTVVVQGVPGHEPEVALVSPDAIRGLLRARPLMVQQRFPEILAILDHADSAQRDTNAIPYRVTSGSWRAYAYANTGHAADGEGIVARLLALEPGDVLTRQVLALAVAQQGRFNEAYAQLDSLQRRAPGDPSTAVLHARIDALRDAAARATPAPPSVAPPAR